MAERVRLDLLVVDRGLAPSRERAQRLILAGDVLAGERPATKPGALVAADTPLRLRAVQSAYVSRGGEKLAGALDAFGIDPQGRTALDVGASTGGFTDCLLRRGARRVVALDVGYGQLAWSLRQDPRVVVIERTNVRHLQAADLPEPPELVTVDVSFISLALVLPVIARVVVPSSPVIALVKPQFEAGRGQVGKGGVVRDDGVRAAAVARIRTAAVELAFAVRGEADSVLHGPKGNREVFLWLEAT